MKYTDTQIGFQEFPDEISLLINISNCPFHCPGCHSPELWKDVGTELSLGELNKLINSNKGITCVGFMGGDSNPTYINALSTYIKHNYKDLKVGWYSGNNKISDIIDIHWFDYIKIGSYDKELGGLNCPSTNQKFYNIKHLENKTEWLDWTYKFWKHENIK